MFCLMGFFFDQLGFFMNPKLYEKVFFCRIRFSFRLVRPINGARVLIQKKTKVCYWRTRSSKNRIRLFKTQSTLRDDGSGIFWPDEVVPWICYLTEAAFQMPDPVCIHTSWVKKEKSSGQNMPDAARQITHTLCFSRIRRFAGSKGINGGATKKLIFCRSRIFHMNGGDGKKING